MSLFAAAPLPQLLTPNNVGVLQVHLHPLLSSATKFISSSRTVEPWLGSLTTAEFIRAWLPELGWLNWNYLGSLMTGYARNPSPKYQLISYVILSFALSEAMGLFCLMVTFLICFNL